MSSGFISENELCERRRIRQLEWEKVRRPDQPLEVPEEEYDHRTLFDRLQEQKSLKELEYEETHKLKNMVKGLDDDEVEFLEMVDRSKMVEEKKKEKEEQKELQRFRDRVAYLERQSATHRIEEITPVVTNHKNASSISQKKLLAGAIKKKLPDSSVTQANGERENKMSNEKVTLLSSNPSNSSSDNAESNSRERESSSDDLTVPTSKRLKVSYNDKIDIVNKGSDNTTDSSKHQKIMPSRKCVAILPSYYPVTDSSNSSCDESSMEDYLDPVKPWFIFENRQREDDV